MGEHRLYDGFTAICGPGGIRADPKARTPVVETEASETQEPLEFEQMLASRLRSAGRFTEQRRIGTDLLRDEGEHRLRWHLGSVQHATGMAKEAKLNGETEPVSGTPPGANNCEVGGVEHVVPRHVGRVGRNRK